MTSEQRESKGSILVVDDETYAREVLQRLFVREGYRAWTATGFDETRALMGEQRLDLVTLDIAMPGASGLEVLEWIRERHPEVGVVMASALADLDTVIEAMRLGAYSYLIKPFRLELVTTEIERAMERQRLVAENRAYQQELEEKVAVQTRELRLKVSELEGRDRLVRCQMSAPTMARASDEILAVVEEVLGVDQAVLLQSEEDGGIVLLARADGVDAPARGDPGTGAELPADVELLAVQALREGQPAAGSSHDLAVPLLFQGKAMGVLWVRGFAARHGIEAADVLHRLSLEAALVLWSAAVSEDLTKGGAAIDELLELE